MRRLLTLGLFCLMVLLLPSRVNAQYYFYSDRFYDSDWIIEAGGTFGLMNALTDLGGNKAVGKPFLFDLNFQNSNISGGFYLTGMYKNFLGLRLEACTGTAAGADSLYKSALLTAPGRYARNLSFRSKINEVQLGIEFHPLTFIRSKSDEKDPPKFSPYIQFGVGYFSFDPKAKLNGQWYSLQPLRTEGQGFPEYPDRKPYELKQQNYHVGSGIRVEITDMIVARLEVDHRILQTDYLDDVSQNVDSYIDPSIFFRNLTPEKAALAAKFSYRADEITVAEPYTKSNPRGNPGDNDAFFTIHLKVGVMLGRKRIKN